MQITSHVSMEQRKSVPVTMLSGFLGAGMESAFPSCACDCAVVASVVRSRAMGSDDRRVPGLAHPAFSPGPWACEGVPVSRFVGIHIW